MPDLTSFFGSPVISIIVNVAAVIVCLKASKVLFKIIAVVVALIFLWPLINQMIQAIA